MANGRGKTYLAWLAFIAFLLLIGIAALAYSLHRGH